MCGGGGRGGRGGRGGFSGAVAGVGDVLLDGKEHGIVGGGGIDAELASS